MKRNPHPARGSRITALGVSVTAFVSVVTSFAWNTHQADLVANVVDANVVPVQQATLDANGNLVAAAPTTTSPATTQTPVATIAPTAPAKNGTASAPAKSSATKAPAAPKVAPATPVVPAAPNTAAVAPAAPAPTVVYTCMSPGGKTENPTSSGSCRNASYGYVLTKI
jgi:hypothetical protein